MLGAWACGDDGGDGEGERGEQCFGGADHEEGGDEDGEDPAKFASTFVELGYKPAALGLIVSVRSRRGSTVKTAAGVLGVPFSEVQVEQFDDPYQVPRVLRAMLDAATPAGAAPTGKPRTSWVEKVMATPLLRKPGAARP